MLVSAGIKSNKRPLARKLQDLDHQLLETYFLGCLLWMHRSANAV